jgi:hypothetical protein
MYTVICYNRPGTSQRHVRRSLAAQTVVSLRSSTASPGITHAVIRLHINVVFVQRLNILQMYSLYLNPCPTIKFS